MLIALFLLFITTPSPTILSVRVVDDETGAPLAGAFVRVKSRSEPAVPTATTDDAGLAQFEDLSGDPAYLVRVQKIDYDIIFEPGVEVPDQEETEISVPLPPNANERIFVGLDGARVAEIDTASMLVVQTFRIPGWKQEATSHLYLHPDQDLLYAIAGTEGSIFNSQDRRSIERFEVDGTVESLSIDGELLSVVTSRYDETGQLLILDSATGVLRTNEETGNPRLSPLLFWEPGGNEVFAVDPDTRSLWAIDINPQHMLTHTPTGPYPKEGYRSTDGLYRYAWSTMSFDYLRIAFAGYPIQPLMEQSAPINPARLAVSPTIDELYALDTQLGTLSILDASGEEPPILVAVGKQPTAVVVSADGQWAYVANQESQTISVVYLPSVSVIQTIPVEGQPFSLAARSGVTE
jgi:YVTN family beta-propeller protein